ncbi:winged helix-turn-helix transcriptional regulator [Nonomuraea polychroma]|uniref:winged helix-turn-helix transcriptional regulator n=1 Tax=Nonomuraea polychroma TaxID=46176 RepID=UPI003D934207
MVERAKGVRRFRELHRAIPGISQRMLTLTTQRLCRDGLAKRTAYPTMMRRHGR